ncbi:MAG: hypothetical protein K0Q77_2952 [Anaerosporomusa subterranea]|jgi:hypothetical protein|nr:hypothetical protein [Anaerosporomusa subterranea]
MTRKSIVALVTLFLLVFFANMAMAKDHTDNPIDKAFAQDISEAMNTMEMNYVTEKYMDAWKAEMDNAAIVLKQRYTFAEDKAHIDNYIAAYKKVAEAAAYLKWLNWSDTEEAPNIRHSGTGAASASLSAKANIFKQATLNLINAYHGQLGDDPFKYSYIYSGKGAELAKIRAQYSR